MRVALLLASRTTKNSEKVVFIPETDGVTGPDDSDDENDSPPPNASGEESARPALKPKRSVSERLTKEHREERHLPRVTAYCIADMFRLAKTATFLREKHHVKPRIYDDLLYAAYSLPLLSGDEEGCRHEEAVATEDLPDQAEAESKERAKYINRRGSNPTAADLPAMYQCAELFILSYGVVVFWNFSERQERNILADLTFAMDRTLMSRPLPDRDVETEEFHFEYSPNTRRPRIFNDMITLRSADHFIKMAMSHAIAQSVKLSLFEGRMDDSMAAAAHVPRKLATTGELSMTKPQVMRMSGQLFKLRVDVNLSSNILDTPDFFWESEPTLMPLYSAVRDYLELKGRIVLLNSRTTVLHDMISLLSDSIADDTMTKITWIVILLIAISVVVTTFEVVLRFALIQRNRGHA
ncbi:hypothetical protein BCR37DRAFT_403613 [Protomyces lactucae-debilis]|uniref:DUF155 domain-containing protein n=1 Tax=Protomyces lactucae-debilis TaxID=2754530 RepID=A0A1Y2EZL5_PROLT|nr:uncharacterized protein BCR37DRAFT_403613 [Protomyces lactucae-debilis]ORY77048.1 hypothetical protein BCR37DRAFT_403613 [Protomyces lactucae-debilis]